MQPIVVQTFQTCVEDTSIGNISDSCSFHHIPHDEALDSLVLRGHAAAVGAPKIIRKVRQKCNAKIFPPDTAHVSSALLVPSVVPALHGHGLCVGNYRK